MKKILFVGAEVMPFAATGGLGDVLGSLPSAVMKADKDADVRVVMPYYLSIDKKWRQLTEVCGEYFTELAWRRQRTVVRRLIKDGVTFYFIENDYYFGRNALYGEYDDGERFAYFCKSVMEMPEAVGFVPNVIHAHDWQGALAVVYLKTLYREKYSRTKTLFTIHNIEYQGIFDHHFSNEVLGLSDEWRGVLEYDGSVNLMKAAIVLSDRVSTVSPKYSREILDEEHSHGLHHILRAEEGKLCGILNGIDYEYYDPASKKDLYEGYGWRSIKKKEKNKLSLCRELGISISENEPLISIISRLASHKGLDLVTEKIYNILEYSNARLIVLGKGEERYESFFFELQGRFPERVRAIIDYDRALSKKIYAASDIFLMPSKSEPCGLSQMIASRYGAIPVVRAVGGLYDSIKELEISKEKIRGNGIRFESYDKESFGKAVFKAIELWENESLRQKIVGRIMRTDFSWEGSAFKYAELYNGMLGGESL